MDDSSMSPLLGAVAVVASIVRAVVGAVGRRGTPTPPLDRGSVGRRLGRPAGGDLQPGRRHERSEPLLGAPGPARLGSTRPNGRVAALEQRLLLAGTPRGWTVERVLAAKVLLGGAGAVLGALRSPAHPA